MAFMFENLQVYQKAVDFSGCVCVLTESFPRGYYFLVDQLNRAALSIATNLAEGNGRFTKPPTGETSSPLREARSRSVCRCLRSRCAVVSFLTSNIRP